MTNGNGSGSMETSAEAGQSIRVSMIQGLGV